MKRKYGNRSDWKRVIKREYAQACLDTNEFKGYVTLIHIIEVTEALSVCYGKRKVCIVDDGYMWLQHFPLEKNYSVTTMFDANGEIVQWYIDICSKNGVENNIPWMDDLFLDIVVLATGEVIQKDADELEEALLTGRIDDSLYNLAKDEANNLNKLIEKKGFSLLNVSKVHKEFLVDKLK
ncbi:MAG: DUF402 domain-containing protein [Bacillaceae bacterium]